MAITSVKEWPPLLPEFGLYRMSLKDLRKLCVDSFTISTPRQDIMDGLEAVVSQLNATALPMVVWVNGSFLTEKLDPKDSDIVVRFDGVAYEQANQKKKSVISWLATDLKTPHLCDSYAFAAYPRGHRGYDEQRSDVYWRFKFGFDRQENPKGIAEVVLPFEV